MFIFISGDTGMSDDRKAFSLAGAARFADRSVGTMRTATKYGGLAHQIVGRQVVIFRADLEEWLSRPEVIERRRRGERIRNWARPGLKAEAATA